jgi:AAA+ superfamily predicted ATPase
MSTESWQADNNRYLAASLQWLRLRLQRLLPEEPRAAASNVAPPHSPGSAPGTSVDEERGLIQRSFASGLPATERLVLSSEPQWSSSDDNIQQAAAERKAAAETDPPPALVLLAQQFGLSAFERDTLLLCAAVEFDPALVSLYALAQGNPARTYTTFGLALSAFDDPAWEALAAHRPLRHARLIEINQPGATPLTASPLRADERIVNFIKGLNVLDDRLAALLNSVDDSEGTDLAESQQAVVEPVLHRLRAAAEESDLPVVQLVGADTGSKLAVARQACAVLHRHLYRISVEALPPQLAEIETLARLWQRETYLLPVALYIEAENLDGTSAETQAALQRLLSRGVGLAFLGVREVPVRFNSASFPVEVTKPLAAEQFAAWTNVLAECEAESEINQTAAMLTGQFNLNLSDIHRAASLAVQAPAEQGTLSRRLWDACCDLTRPRLDALAQRLDVKATWDDLVLPDEQLSIMHKIVVQVRKRFKVYNEWGFAEKMNRGFGISALFSGESGTGKTMAAEVIANDLRLNLYRIDLSAVVSKYIGETEKNLRTLFDAAEQGGAILFFDEADALFGKRSEVQHSHDRYANIEINYLLQRMEAFSGLAILATNMKSALDPAFMRRLGFMANFGFPSVKERKLIWQKALPVQTPRDDLDYDRLARLNVAGGTIHKIALNAAFLAAGRKETVTMAIILEAARSELRKLDRRNEAEFRVLEAVRGKS